MKGKFRIVVLLFLIVLNVGAVQGEVRQNGEKVIVVGGNVNYPPYEFIDAEGNPSGYNVDLTKAIADVMGIKVIFKLGAWNTVRKAFDTGDIDVLQGMSYSEGRAKEVNFIPHTVVSHSIFSRPGVPVVNSLEDLEGKEVAFHGRGFIHDYLIERNITVKPVLTNTQADALVLVASGNFDYAVVANYPAAYIIKELRLNNVVPVAKSVIEVDYCYAIKKSDTKLLAGFSKGLETLKKTGKYQEIYDKWLGVLEPQIVPWHKIFKYGSMVIGLFLIVLAVTLLWTRTLKKQVAIRTAALEQEVNERKRSAEELRLKQQQLIQADKMASLGILVSGIAHEINNPNSIVLLNASLSVEYFKDAESVFETYYQEHGDFTVAGLQYSQMRGKFLPKLLAIQDSARKIKSIVEELKDFARYNKSDQCAMNINDAVRAAVRLAENSIQKSTNHFNQQYADNIPQIKANPQRIEQVIVNLIINACQALRNTEEAIYISTKYDKDKKEVVLEIRDEGVGIAAESLPHLTDPFFTTKREQGGTGLGLSVSAGIVKEHRGYLDFVSNLGQGTIVALRLPAVTETEEVKT